MEKRIRILMFGWELPPFNSGGLGVACQGLSNSLAKTSDIIFVLPKRIETKQDFEIIFADSSHSITAINSSLSAYSNSENYSSNNGLYGSNLFDEVERYANKSLEIIKNQKFDVIHAHDWLSFKAAIKAKEISGKPLVVHIHATEFDRTGGNSMNKEVFDIEKKGMEVADKVIAVSNFTKKIIEEKYGIDPAKVQVIHNRINVDEYDQTAGFDDEIYSIKKSGKKIVLFVGRITLQKGPEYFLEVAKRTLEYEKNIMFVMAGTGDMEREMMQNAAVMGISDKVLFTGFLNKDDVSRLFRMADLFVLPSVSEPFSITTLESIVHDTPVLISNQSGVSEILKHALKVDFWDIDEMTNKILSVVNNPSLGESLAENSKGEIKGFSWDMAANECLNLYKTLIHYE